ncbi:MAG: hydrogenase formation protein HypD [Armatimonadia bacterium]|nr:hydrogenase formation protein HypD [Armatimonadia bacterium]
MSLGLEGLRDVDAARAIAAEIAEESRQPLKLMEVCGSHSHAIARYGLHDLLPDTIELVPGPGCPVCVAPQEEIDLAIELARDPGVVLTTFGDLIRVPGTHASMDQVRAEGGDVRIVLSPMDALATARQEPQRLVVFVAIGFETTAPGVAATVRAAEADGVDNFSLLVAHKTMPAPMRALVEAGECGVQGFICPGHVSTIIGSEAYRFLPDEYGVACAVAGFEPLDVLLAVRSLVRQHETGQPQVDTQYGRAVRAEGNPKALGILNEVFEVRDSRWRGLGEIPVSGLGLAERYRSFDVEDRLGLARHPVEPNPACRCGEVLRGIMRPMSCPAFGKACTPEDPLGPCMVSSEGACAAAWQYRS